MSAVHIYQIYYDDVSQRILDPGFIALDNSANERPDWSELWPIRRHLQSHALDEQAYYGFLSPKFNEKTGWTAQDLQRFFHTQTQNNATPDALLIPVFWDQVAYFRNVFEQGEFFHPGILPTAQAFFDRIGIDTHLASLVMHSRNTVYCNYIVARPAFWRRWMCVCEALFEIAETPGDPLGEQLRRGTAHAGVASYPFKVFIQERVASFLLTTELWSTCIANVFSMPPLLSSLAHLQDDLIVCDALKQAWSQTGNPVFETQYFMRRNQVTAAANARLASQHGP